MVLLLIQPKFGGWGAIVPLVPMPVIKGLQIRLQIKLLSIIDLSASDAVSGWAGWALAHPEFGSSVHPIPTREGRLCPPHVNVHTKFLKPQGRVLIRQKNGSKAVCHSDLFYQTKFEIASLIVHWGQESSLQNRH